jgi:hypothetical protein
MKAYVLIKIRAGKANEVVKSLRKLDAIMASMIQPISDVEQTLTCLAVDI